MGGVISLLENLFFKPPATPPPHVQNMAVVDEAGSSREAAPKEQRSSTPRVDRNVSAVPVKKAGQVDVARLIKEARLKVGVDCVKHYNFAVCGQTGVGKSSFINGFLGLNGGDACSVGEVETTQKIQKYSTKRAPYLMVWDIPGAGTIDHPADTYFEDKKLYVFDAVLIVSSDRFLAVDFEILRSARKYGTPCMFVRTKCDLSVHSRAQRDGVDTLTASKGIRSDITSSFHASLAKAGLKDIKPEPELFLISNNSFWDKGAYALYDKKAGALDTSLSSLDELKLQRYIYDTAKIRAPQLKLRNEVEGGKLMA